MQNLRVGHVYFMLIVSITFALGSQHKRSFQCNMGYSVCIYIQLLEIDVQSLPDFPDHATLREKGAKLACADKLGAFLSLTLCKKAKFDPLQHVKYDGLEKIVIQ